MTITYYLNIIGLALDIIGVVGLFYSVGKGLRKISANPIRISSTMTWGNADNIEKKMHDELYKTKTEINDIIEKNNNENNIIHRRAFKWLMLILLGFLFQLSSNIIPLICHSAH
jgi:hypothetical protein